jgi:hypothetical protein
MTTEVLLNQGPRKEKGSCRLQISPSALGEEEFELPKGF